MSGALTQTQIRTLRFLSSVAESTRFRCPLEPRHRTEAVWIALRRKGLIEFTRWEERDAFYRITDAGRAALAPYEPLERAA